MIRNSTRNFRNKSFWSSDHWKHGANGPVLDPVQKKAKEMGTDPEQADVLWQRNVQLPGYLDIQPARDLAKWWGCPDLPSDLFNGHAVRARADGTVDLSAGNGWTISMFP